VRALYEPRNQGSFHSSFQTRPSPLRLGTPYTDSGDGVCISGANMGGSGITGVYHNESGWTVAIATEKIGVRRSHCLRSGSGTTLPRWSRNKPSGGTIGVIIGVGVSPEISSRDGAHRQEYVA